MVRTRNLINFLYVPFISRYSKTSFYIKYMQAELRDKEVLYIYRVGIIM